MPTWKSTARRRTWSLVTVIHRIRRFANVLKIGAGITCAVLCVTLTACSPLEATPGTTGTGAPAAGQDAPPQTPLNGTPWTDTDGNPLHAHGGGMLKHGDTYYWVGENRGADDKFRAVSIYRSTDLTNWTFARDILTQDSHPELASANVERPKLLFNEATNTFVLWMHWENGTDYSQARVAVATSPTADGNYTYRGSYRPLGHDSRDMTVFQDDDGTAYLVSATAANADLHLYRLDDSYTGVTTLVTRLWPGAFREAPALFKRDGVYFLLTSGATGWTPNQARFATATSLEGPWTDLRDVGDGEAFGSQAAYVMPITGDANTDFLYLGDRWAGARGGRVNESDYVWLNLDFPDAETVSLDWSNRLTIDANRGTILAAGSGSKPFSGFAVPGSGLCLDAPAREAGVDVILWTCNGGVNQQWQILDVTDESKNLRSRDSGLCVTIDGADDVLRLRACSGDSSQVFASGVDGVGENTLATPDGRCVFSRDPHDGASLSVGDCATKSSGSLAEIP